MLRAKEIEGCGGGTLDLEWLFQAALPWPPKGVSPSMHGPSGMPRRGQLLLTHRLGSAIARMELGVWGMGIARLRLRMLTSSHL